MPNTAHSAEIGDQIESIVRDRAGNECVNEDCTATENLDIYNTNSSDEFEIDSLKLLCNDCYHEKYSKQKINTKDVLNYFKSTDLPFTTASEIAQEFNIATRTSRRRLNDLVETSELERYELDQRRTLYFTPDFRAGNEFLDGLREAIDLTELDTDAVKAFARQPYKVLPKGGEEYYVVVPNFLNFNLGHLHEKTDAWRTYIINRYVSWFSELPSQIKNEITLRKKYESATLDGDTLELANEDERERAWEDFGGQDGPLVERKGDSQIKIQQNKEFEVISTLVDGGNLPFTPSPIDPEDIHPAPPDVTLREYQKEAWETFEKYGSVGVFWPMGLGKSWWSLHAGYRIKGSKLVIVPSSTLREQWKSEIQDRARNPDQWDVRTYQYLTHSDGSNLEEYMGEDAPTLTIFDEAHHTPADKFSQLAMIPTKYRIGLSASPYREDGRTEFIFALTGMPVGVDWKELVKHGIVEYPDVHVYTYRTQRQKREDLYDIIEQKPGNGLVFCDSRDRGEEISNELDVPFVNGDTPSEDRLDIINDNKVVVASRVADEGMSISALDYSIEHDFLGSSRMQETQRAGRVMHRETNTESTNEDAEQLGVTNGLHIVQMTDNEYEKHSERLYSLEEKGFNIQLERRA